MANEKPITQWMHERKMTVDQLLESSRLDKKVIEAIVNGQYTPSPQQRQRLAIALEVAVEEIQWGHTVPVDHMHGHGPQFGRSP